MFGFVRQNQLQTQLAALGPRRLSRGQKFLRALRGIWWVLKNLGKATRWIGRHGWAHRRMAAPVYLAILLLLVAAGLNSTGTVKAAVTGSVLWAIVGAWVAWRLHRNTIARKLGVDVNSDSRTATILRALVPGSGGSWRAFPHAVKWGWVTYVAAGAWFLTAALWTPTQPMFPGVWLLLLGGAGRSWWRFYRVRPIDVMDEDEKRARWINKVAKKPSGPIPGSELDVFDPILAEDGSVLGFSAEGTLDDEGQLTCNDVSNTKIIGRVALAYRTDAARIALEPTESREAHRFKFWWFTIDPLEKIRYHQGPAAAFDPATGLFRLGRHRDGFDTHIRFYRAGYGVVFQTLIGTTGGGKSETENMLLAVERSSPFMVSLVIDPQRGQSLPDWVDNVHGFAKTEVQGLTLLRAFHQEALAINEYLANVKWVDDRGNQRTGVPFMDPLRHNGPDRIGDRDLPIISLTVCEAGKLLAIPEAVQLLEEAAETLRKCGMLLRLDIQGSLIDQWRSRRLRKMMFGGTVIHFRSDDPLDGSIALGKKSTGDPTTIPSEFANGATTAGMAYVIGAGNRPSAMRVDLCANAFELATAGELTPWTPLSQELRDWIADKPGVRDGGNQPVNITKGVGAKSTDIDKVLQVVLTGLDLTGKPVARYADGSIGNGAIIAAAGVTSGSAAESLRRLKEAGKIVKVDTGKWAAPEDDELEPELEQAS